MDALVDHLFFIYRAIFELNMYHPCWLELLKLVLGKIADTMLPVMHHIKDTWE
jgi:hypothetical protein